MRSRTSPYRGALYCSIGLPRSRVAGRQIVRSWRRPCSLRSCAALVITKPDRPTRNAAFPLTLRDSSASFVAVDTQEANDLTVGIVALVAQQKREAISKFIMEALAAEKSRGVKLGSPNGAAALRRAGDGGLALRATMERNADELAKELAPVVAEDLTRAGGGFDAGYAIARYGVFEHIYVHEA